MTEFEIKEILALALRYPSGDNCQPFYFVFKGNKLEVFYSYQKGKAEFNFSHLASCLSLGMLLEGIEISSHSLGFITNIQILNINDSTSPWVNIIFNKGSENSSSATTNREALLNRRTDRNIYSNFETPAHLHGFFEKIGIRSRRVKPEDPIIEMAQNAERFFWRNSTAVKELFTLVRFSHQKYLQTRVGIYWKELGVKAHELPLTLLFWLCPTLPRILYPFFLRFITNDIIRRNLISSSEVIAIPVRINKSDSLDTIQRNYIECGRIAMKAWIELTKFEMVAQPITALSLLWVIDHPSIKGQNFGLKEFEKAELDSAHRSLLRWFGMDNQESIGWILRIGKPKTKNNKLMSLRKNIDDVLTINTN